MPFKKDFLNLLEDFKAALTPTEDAPAGQRTDLVLTGHFRKMMRKGVFETAAFANMDLAEMQSEMETVTPLDQDDITENNLLHEAMLLGRPQALRILLHIARARDEIFEAVTAQNSNSETPAEYGAHMVENLTKECRALDVKLQMGQSEDAEKDKEKLERGLNQIVHIKECQEVIEAATSHAKARQSLKNSQNNPTNGK